MKKFFLPLVLFGLITFNCFSQSGVKWSADGNSPSSNDFFGTNNVFPIVFKTAAIERMRLSESGNFGIGVINPTHKFEVGGNSLFTGDLEVTGTINFTSTQTANIVAPMIKTGRITALDGDTLIHIGDSSFVFFTQVGLPDRMWSNKMNFGLGIGLASWGRGRGSVAIGRYVDAYGEYSYTMGTLLSTSNNAERSVVIGSGFDNSNTTRLVNDIPNSLMIGFNSTVPTLFVSPALGPAINTTGNVGIGTTNPKEKLQIGNTFVFHDGGSKVIARNFYYDGLDKRIEDGKSAAIYFGDGDIALRIAIDGTANSPISWINALYVKNDGHVGIGTTTPEQTLDVRGNIQCGGHDFILGKYDDRANPAGGHRALVHDGWDMLKDELVINYAGDFLDGVHVMGDKTYFDGYVGIATNPTDPNFKLQVCGAIKATRVKVVNSWCDYVFDEKYKLISLTEVEAYINKNKHLPNIPDAVTVENDGLDIGFMQAKQMEKIEEIMLYLIDLKKENETLKERIIKLESQNNIK